MITDNPLNLVPGEWPRIQARISYNATGEFSQENFSNDPRPGRVTRLPGDPLYNAGNNPDRDDDFYCAGTYPIGFNGLTTNLPVPFQEPDLAWERALTDGDRTNRVHFFLSAAQAGAQAGSGREGEALPLGVQVIAAPWREDICLRIAHQLEAAGVCAAPVARGFAGD